VARLISWQLLIDWDRDGNYTDESARLISARGAHRLINPEEGLTAGRGIVDQMTFSLDNVDGRFSALNTSGALYAHIGNGKAYHAPVKLLVATAAGGSYTQIFQGVIEIPNETGATSRQAGRVEIDARSRDELLRNARQSTTSGQFATIYSNLWTEEQIIATWLEGAGLIDGADFVSQAYHAANPSTLATLDPGLWRMGWAWLDDESPLEEIWLLSAACGGRFYSDPAGVFRYENAAHWLSAPHLTPAATLGKGDFQTLQAAYDDRELFSGVTVEASPRVLLDQGVLWEQDTPVLVPAGQTKTVTARLRQPAYSVTAATYTAITSGGVDITASVSVSLTKYAQRVEITITNSHASQAAIMAVLALTGQAVDGSPTEEATRDSVDSFWSSRGQRRRAIRGNPYIQSAAQAAFLAEYLRDRYQSPRLHMRVRNVDGNPARRMGDRITVTDADVMSASRDGLVVGITWSLDNAGFRQDLEMIDASEIFAYGSDYFTLNTDTLNAGTSSPGRLFY
jgi:hypothetical protein